MTQLALSTAATRVDFGSLTPKQIKTAEYLAHNISIQRIATLVKTTPMEISRWIKDDHFRDVVSQLQVNVALEHQELSTQLAFLGGRQILDILTQDYESAGEQERREIARTARFAVETHDKVSQQPIVTANVFAPQQNNIAIGSVDAIARRIRELELEGEEVRIVDSYVPASVPATYRCHPDTDFGAFNYDEEIDKRQCHSCGKWVQDIYDHAQALHGLTRETYNNAYGIES
jgi:hypothetical protein